MAQPSKGLTLAVLVVAVGLCHPMASVFQVLNQPGCLNSADLLSDIRSLGSVLKEERC